MAVDEDEAPQEEADADKISVKERFIILKPWLQVGGLVVLLMMLMTTSLVTGLMVTGVININPENKRVVSNMGDAMSICDGAIHDEHGSLLQTFALDDLSSHGDKESGGYRLYYELNMYRDNTRQTGVNKFYVNCFVSAKGRIKRLDLLEDKSFVPRALRRSKGNAIGL
ncbi:MAG: hypothetical protein ACRBBR_07830 [Cellvibrionaceae bacterium]